MTEPAPFRQHDLLYGRRVVRIDKVNGLAFVEALIGAWENGSVAMPIDPEAPAPRIGLPISAEVRVEAGGGWITPVLPSFDDDAPALISFTSGTTGEPKAILLTHGALSDVTRRLVDVMQLDSSVREYVAVPVTYSFGGGRIRAVAAAGGKAFVPGKGFRPDELARMLAGGEVNALSAVPSMLRIILAQPSLFEPCGNKLRWLEIGSQYMAGAEKAALRELFPNARIVQHYGLTEASRSTFLVIDEAGDGGLDSVGGPTGSVQVRINEAGLICIRGAHVASGRIVDGRLEPLTDEDGWLCTADLGSLNGGELTFLGRSDDVANVAGIKISADHFEQNLLKRSGASGEIVGVAIGDDPLRGQRLIVATAPSADRASIERAARALASESGLGAADLSFVAVPAIPRTETGKIRRAALAAAAEEALHAAASGAGQSGPPRGDEAQLAAIWKEILGVSEVRPEDSFYDLGGDSLSAVTVALRAEQAGLPSGVMHMMFDGRSLREIGELNDAPAEVAAPPATRRSQLSTAINATRGILVLMVIGAHWLPFLYDRMGDAGVSISVALRPVFHIGTPGFAIIFGVGLVFFYRPLMERSEASFRQKLRFNTKLLAAGVFLQAGCNLLARFLAEGQLSPIWPEQGFYSVLLFYLLMVPTAGIWLRIIYASTSPALNALLVALAGSLVLLFFQTAWPLAPGDGFVRLVQHMLIAPYAYPQLLAAVCVGAAIGLWAEQHAADRGFSLVAAKLGLVLLAAGVAAVALFTDGWWKLAQSPAAFPAYAGAVILALAGLTALVERDLLRTPIRLLAVIGLLAFPAFVGHGIVIPLVRILTELSVPYVLALSGSVGLFLVGSFLAIRKLYRMLFGTAVRGGIERQPAAITLE